MSFNRTPISSLHALSEAVETPVPSSHIGDRDRFPSWQFVNKERELGGERWLMRNGRGGLAWLHIDKNDMAYDYSVIPDDEARELWPRLILQFRDDEAEALKRELQPAERLEEAIEAALGGTALLQGSWLDDEPSDDGTTKRQMLVHLRGIVRAWVHGSGHIVRSELVTGQDAWGVVGPLIDS